jgi:hypothetical protein
VYTRHFFTKRRRRLPYNTELQLTSTHASSSRKLRGSAAVWCCRLQVLLQQPRVYEVGNSGGL